MLRILDLTTPRSQGTLAGSCDYFAVADMQRKLRYSVDLSSTDTVPAGPTWWRAESDKPFRLALREGPNHFRRYSNGHALHWDIPNDSGSGPNHRPGTYRTPRDRTCANSQVRSFSYYNTTG